MSCSQKNFTTGEQVPVSRIYSIKHPAHRLSVQVALFKGELFPNARNARCGIFLPVHKFSRLDAAGLPTFRTPLYELAAMEDAEPRNAA